MTLGAAGYGRYNDDLQHVGCPRARSDMTPCVARDGHLALADEPNAVCVGCGADPVVLLSELRTVLDPTAARYVIQYPKHAADRLTALVREVAEP